MNSAEIGIIITLVVQTGGAFFFAGKVSGRLDSLASRLEELLGDIKTIFNKVENSKEKIIIVEQAANAANSRIDTHLSEHRRK